MSLLGNPNKLVKIALMKKSSFYPMLQALIAAALFGASAPLSKLMLNQVEPVPLAAFLYLGSGFGAMIFWIIQRRVHIQGSDFAEANIRGQDYLWMAGALLAGGVAAPIILLLSLQITPASTASLLLNFESVATTLIAALLFKEAIGRRIWGAIIAITIASVLLSWKGSGWGLTFGALGILAACGLWGLDNNFTRNISAKNPLAIVAIKGIGAGTFSLILAFVLRIELPTPGNALGALLLGSISYGLSIVLFVLALRGLGAARTSALFGAAPFIGALLALLIFRESPTPSLILAFLVMVAGAYLLLGEDHQHRHEHQVLLHDHRHSHVDGHHTHQHDGDEVQMEHSHLHSHAHNVHKHPHAPDLHHRHAHSN